MAILVGTRRRLHCQLRETEAEASTLHSGMVSARVRAPREFQRDPLAVEGFRLSAGYRFERRLALIILFLATGPFFDLLGSKAYGSVVIQLLWAGLYLLALALLTLRFQVRWIVWLAHRLPAAILVLALIMLSCVWSLDPSLTLKRSVSLVGTTLVGAYLGLRFSPRDLMHILFRAFLLIVALSVVVILVNPGYGTMGFVWNDRFPDAWKGFMHHKTALAAISASGTLVCLAMLVSREGRRRVLWLSGMVGFMFVVVMAKSAAALAALFLAIVIVWTLPRLRRFQFRFLWVCILMTYAGVITAFVVTQWLPIFTDLVGRDATLTGRVSIWEDALGMIAERPLIGFGYEAVWTPPGGTHLPQFERSAHASHAHNGYLNIATQAGIPAALLAASFVVVTLYRAMRAYFLAPSSFLGFSVGYLLMFAIMSMAGSTLFGYQEFEWVLFMAVSAAITRIALDRVGSASRCWRTTAIPPMAG